MSDRSGGCAAAPESPGRRCSRSARVQHAAAAALPQPDARPRSRRVRPRPRRGRRVCRSSRADPHAGAGRSAAVAGPARPTTTMAVLEQERWASPLRDEFRAALLEELIVGQGAIDARTQPVAGSDAAGVAVDVRRFDSAAGRRGADPGLVDDHRWWARSGSRCEWLFGSLRRGRWRDSPRRIGARSAGLPTPISAVLAHLRAARRRLAPRSTAAIANRLPAARSRLRRSGPDGDVVLDRLHALDLHRDAFGRLFSSGDPCDARKHDVAVRVSTVIASASTDLSSAMPCLDAVVIAESST